MKQLTSRLTIIFIIIGFVLSFLVVLPYLHKGYFPTHDGEWAVVRAGEMFREIRDHQFPPRYSGFLNFGYGYPLFNFAYPAPYYMATILHFLHIGFVDSIKVLFAASVFMSFVGMFFLSGKFWKSSWAGFISGVFYILLPYYLVDLYVRGSIGESMSLALYPFLLLCCLFILEKKHVRTALFFLAMLSAALITAHNIAAVYFGIIFAAYITALFISKKNKEAFITIGGFLWGACISAFFFAPALLEKQNIKLSKIPIADRSLYYVSFQKLLFSPFGYGTPTDKNPFTYQLGLPQIAGFFLSCAIFLKLKSTKRVITGVFILLSLVFTFMMFPAASFIWKLPLLSEINYPWTCLLPLGFLMSFLSGALSQTKLLKIVSFVLLFGALVLYTPLAKPQSFVNRGDTYYLTNPATTTSSNELMPLWVKIEPQAFSQEKIKSANKIENLVYSSNKISFSVSLSKPGTITVNQIYYPGWVAYSNTLRIPITYKNKQGVMQLHLGSGKDVVLLRFTETKERLFADTVSLISLIALLVFGVGILFLQAKTFFQERG